VTKPSSHIAQFDRAYFIGIGGIGMSSLSRYFNNLGWKVAGYDKTSTPLTQTLEQEGIEIHYDDLGPSIPELFQNKEKTLVIYTPAIPINHGELMHVKHNDFQLFKRAEVLGMITRNTKAIGVAGTHGKTTTSTILTHLLHTSNLKCNAFLGGIATNFNSNFVSSKESQLTVIEADEFDRSFLQLNPFASIITSTDADHLDIYGSENQILEGFQEYINLTDKAGFVVKHINANIKHSNLITYNAEIAESSMLADYNGYNLQFKEGKFSFDLKIPNGIWENIILGIPGIHNVANAIACIITAIELGVSEKTIRLSLETFKGVKRRFEYHIKKENKVYIDDYAHHPTEIKALVSSIRLLYPNKKITAVFQPHLFTRTQDFFNEFAKELSEIDDLVLLPIYPAREEPITGVTSDALLSIISSNHKIVLKPNDAIQHCVTSQSEIILTIGAGDIDEIINPIKQALA
tara:strand:+ start:3318 stop:4703 length:1386 start_codon:yes stop_codon:yes gene_type:complete